MDSFLSARNSALSALNDGTGVMLLGDGPKALVYDGGFGALPGQIPALGDILFGAFPGEVLVSGDCVCPFDEA